MGAVGGSGSVSAPFDARPSWDVTLALLSTWMTGILYSQACWIFLRSMSTSMRRHAHTCMTVCRHRNSGRLSYIGRAV